MRHKRQRCYRKQLVNVHKLFSITSLSFVSHFIVSLVRIWRERAKTCLYVLSILVVAMSVQTTRSWVFFSILAFLSQRHLFKKWESSKIKQLKPALSWQNVQAHLTSLVQLKPFSKLVKLPVQAAALLRRSLEARGAAPSGLLMKFNQWRQRHCSKQYGFFCSFFFAQNSIFCGADVFWKAKKQFIVTLRSVQQRKKRIKMAWNRWFAWRQMRLPWQLVQHSAFGKKCSFRQVVHTCAMSNNWILSLWSIF